jgi:hypothetical protein
MRAGARQRGAKRVGRDDRVVTDIAAEFVEPCREPDLAILELGRGVRELLAVGPQPQARGCSDRQIADALDRGLRRCREPGDVLALDQARRGRELIAVRIGGGDAIERAGVLRRRRHEDDVLLIEVPREHFNG